MYKIKRSHLYLILLTALFLHLTILNRVRISGAAPDLMLIVVIFFGLFFGAGAGLEAGLAAGIMKDLFTLDYFGINMAVYGVTGLILGILNAKFYKESRMTQFLLVFSFTIFSIWLHYILASAFSGNLALGFLELASTSALPAGVYTGLAALPVFSKFIDLYGLKHLEDLL